jgi:hypothetical protein
MDQAPKKPETKKGINWLNVIGLVFLVLVVIAVIVLVPVLKDMQANKVVQDVSGMQPWLTAMETMTKSQIAAEAEHQAATDLLASPTGLEGRWVVTWGSVSGEESNMVAGNIARNVMSEKNYPAFILDNGLVFIDVSGEGEMNVPDGTVITGYGKVFVLRLADVWAIPIVGPDLKKEFGDLKDMEQQVVFFLSKGYDIGEPGPAGSLIAPPAEGGAPVEGEAVEGAPADGVPAEGGEAAPPAGEGATPAPPAGEGGEPAPPAGDPPAAPGAGG